MRFLLDILDLVVYNLFLSIETEEKLKCRGLRNWQTGFSDEAESENFTAKALTESHHYIWNGFTW